MKYILIIIILAGSFFTIQAQENDHYKILNVQIYKDSISHKEVQLIDVRTPEEYKAGHVEYAENIDFFSNEFTSRFKNLDVQKPIYIYCRSGQRSKQASIKLVALGFKEIYDLEGGILNYN